MLKPAEIDALAAKDCVTITDLRHAIPQSCYVIDPWKSWGSFLRALACIASFAFLLSRVDLAWDATLLWRLPLVAALELFYAWAFVGLFVLGHDCGHLSFSSRRWVNYLVGHICFAPLLTGYHNWKFAHNHHHTWTQIRKQDTDWPEKMVTWEEFKRLSLHDKLYAIIGFATPFGILFGFWATNARRTVMPIGFPQVPLTPKKRRQIWLSNVVTVACSGAFIVLLWRFTGPAGLVKYYLFPSVIAMATGAFLTLMMHSKEDMLVFDKKGWTPFRGQVVSTFDVRFPELLEQMWFKINLHLPHHLLPKIPWYNLERAANAIQAKYPNYRQERRFRFSDLHHLWARPVLRRPPGADWYELAPIPSRANAADPHPEYPDKMDMLPSDRRSAEEHPFERRA